MKVFIVILSAVADYFSEAAGIKCIQGTGATAAAAACSNNQEKQCNRPKFVEYTGMSADGVYGCGKCHTTSEGKTCETCTGDSCNKPKKTGADFKCKNWELKSEKWSVAAASSTCKRLIETKIMCNKPGTKATKDTKVTNAGCGPCGAEDKKNNLCADCDKAECNTESCPTGLYRSFKMEKCTRCPTGKVPNNDQTACDCTEFKVDNGKVEPIGKVQEEKVVTVSCVDSRLYVLLGEEKVTCQSGGWTEKPACRRFELETKGGVFVENSKETKISCGLTAPMDWIKQTVKLTLEKVGETDNKQKLTCNSDPASNNGKGSFGCTALKGTKPHFKIVKPISIGVFVTVTLSEDFKSTTSFRCSVEVGKDNEEKATDTKLIYAQQIDVKFRNDNLDEYQKMTTDDSLKVSVYGDDIYALNSTESKCKLGSGAETAFSQFTCTIPKEQAKVTNKLECTLTFDKNHVVDKTVTHTPAVTVVAACGNGEYWKTAGCTACLTNTYREASSMPQFVQCRSCPAGKEPDAKKSVCINCGSGKTSTASTVCEPCPAGTKQEGNSCNACPAGRYQDKAGQTACKPCEAGRYSIALGSSSCSPCPAGTFPAEDASKCVPCAKGSYRGASDAGDRCKPCPAGQYTSVTGSTSCLHCQGRIEDDDCKVCKAGEKFEGGTCKPCDRGEVSEAGSASCTLCSPGTKAGEGSNTCIACEPGEYQPKAGQITCIPCDSDRGEFQTEKGSSHCKTTKPGYQLNQGNSAAEEVKCEKDYYSSGRAKNCVKCRIENVCRGEGEKSDVFGNYSWPSTTPGEVAKLPCFFKSSHNVVATKLCVEETAKFAESNLAKCSSAATKKIKDILTDSVSEKTQDSVSEEIAKVVTTLGNVMSASDIEDVSGIIKKVTAVKNLSKTALDNIINTVDGIQTLSGGDQLKLGDTGSKIRNSTVGILLAIAAGADKEVVITKKSIGFGIAKKTQGKDVLALAGDPEVLSNSTGGENEPNTYFQASVSAKEETIACAVFYQDDKSFPSQAAASSTDIVQQMKADKKDLSRGRKEFSLITTVIADIQIINKTSATFTTLDASNDINVLFRIADTKSTITAVTGQIKRKELIRTSYHCKFYDENLKLWSDRGCKTTFNHDDDGNIYSVYCLCDHLTSFAVLMSFEKESVYVEELISQILLTASLIGLSLTILAHLPNRRLLKMRSVKINLMLSLSLLFSIILFLIMDAFTSDDENEDPSIPCIIIGMLLNYSWLTQLCWMVVEAVTLYMALVTVLGVHINQAMIKFSLFAWGLPIAFPIIGYVWGGNKFVDATTCFISRPYGLLTFYGPVALGILTNLGLFFSIARVIIKQIRSKAERDPENQSELSLRTKQAKSALAISTILGLGWIVGFFLLFNNSNYSEIASILRWLFIILNAPQGFLIFVFYVLLREDLRTFWMQLFKGGAASNGNARSSMMSTRVTYSVRKVEVTADKIGTAEAKSVGIDEIKGNEQTTDSDLTLRNIP